MTPDEHLAYLKATTAPPGDEQEHWDALLASFGFLADGASLTMEQLLAKHENMVAFYSTGTKAITIVDRDGRNDDETLSRALVHEYVHAMQDDEIGLVAYWEAHVGSLDEDLAALTLIEGEAVLYEELFKLEAWGKSPDAVDWSRVWSDRLERTLDRVAYSSNPYVDALIGLPYALGGREITPIWMADKERGIEAVFDDPALHTEAWLAGTVTDPSSPRLVEPAAPKTPGPLEPRYQETLGAYMVLTFLTNCDAPQSAAVSASVSWRGDRVFSYGDENGAFGAGIWSLVFAHDQAAMDFESAASFCDLPDLEEISRDGSRVTLETSVISSAS